MFSAYKYSSFLHLSRINRKKNEEKGDFSVKFIVL